MELKRILKIITLPILLAVLLFYIYNGYSRKIQYFPDEYFWVGHSYFFDLFIKGQYRDPLVDTWHAYDQPHLTYYIYGLALYPDFLQKGEHTSFLGYLRSNRLYQDGSKEHPEWDTLSHEFDEINFNTPCKSYLCESITLINRMRSISLFFLIIAAVITYFTTQLITNNTVLSLLAAFYWGSHLVIIDWGLLAQAEAIFLLFFNLSMFLTLYVFIKKKTSVSLLISTSVATALAFSAKLHGLLVLFSFLLISFAYFIEQKNRSKHVKIVIRNSILYITVFIITTIIFNIYLWKNPLEGVKMMYKSRTASVQDQQESFKKDALPTIQIRIVKLYDHFFIAKDADDFSKSLFFTIPSTVKLLLFFVGLCFLIALAYTERSHRYFLISTIPMLLFMMRYLQLDWDRYYNILVFPFIMVLLFGVKGIIACTRLAINRLIHRL